MHHDDGTAQWLSSFSLTRVQMSLCGGHLGDGLGQESYDGGGHQAKLEVHCPKWRNTTAVF